MAEQAFDCLCWVPRLIWSFPTSSCLGYPASTYCRQIKNHPQTKSVPVILADNAQRSPSTFSRASRAAADNYVTKPFRAGGIVQPDSLPACEPAPEKRTASSRLV